MFILISQEGSKAYYFLENKAYSIGRKDCDILIKDDNSISKKHAVLKIEAKGNLELTDIGSKYKTLVNNEELQVNKPVHLKEGDVIKFGILHSIFRLEQKKISALCSNLSDTDKSSFTNLVTKLNGSVLKKWSRNCTHLTVREIMLTLKVLSALIEGIPIVSLKFWEDMLTNIGRNIPPPDEGDHIPPYSEMFLSKNVSFKYNPERKVLFRDKVFVFKTSKSKAKVQDVIILAGGRSILYTDETITDQKLTSDNPQYLFVIDDENSQQSSKFDDIVDRLKKENKRLIPHQEIAMALLMCSCEKDCNPNFDRIGTLMAPEETNAVDPVMLAMDTQPQTQSQSDLANTEGFAPETFEEDIFVPVVSGAPTSSTQVDVVDLCDTSPEKGGVKRLADDLHHEEVKRKRVSAEMQKKSADLPSPISKTDKPTTSYRDFFKKPNEKSTGDAKSSSTSTNHRTTSIREFFKPSVQKSTNDPNSTLLLNTSETPLITPKRKSEDTISEQPSKRRNQRINPFALSNKPKLTQASTQKPANEPQTPKTNAFARLSEISQISKSKRYLKGKTTIDDSDNNDVIEIKDEPIDIKQESTLFTVTPIDIETERSFQWLTKSMQEDRGDVKLDLSNPLAALLESFKGCVVVETKQLVVSKGRCDVGTDTVDASGRCIKNFKKFKKVRPMHVQTMVIPESSYVRVVCNQSQAIGSDFEDDDVDGLESPFSRSGPSQPKRSARKIYGV